MQYWHPILLFIASFLAAMINSVAGGGSLLVYPLLLIFGVTPIMANATTTATVFPGALSSAYGYRKHLAKLPKVYFLLIIPSVIGGILGAVILKHTPSTTFKYIVPWFILFAVILLMLQPRIHNWLYAKQSRKSRRKHRKLILYLISFGILIAATYGGYFGAGFGIMLLAFLGLTELTDIQQMNGLKNLTGIGINLTASVYFVIYKLVDWHYLPLLIVGSVLGGSIGAHYGSKLPIKVVRRLIICIGLTLVVVLLTRL